MSKSPLKRAAVGLVALGWMSGIALAGGIGVDRICNEDTRAAVSIAGAVDLAQRGSTVFVLSSMGLQSFDVSDTSNPVLLGTVALISGVHTMQIDGDTMYGLTLGNTLISVDISDPSNMSVLAEFLVPIPKGQAFGLTQDIAMSGTTLYVPYAGVPDNGLSLIDVSDPANPALLSRYSGDESIVLWGGDVGVDGTHVYVSGVFLDPEGGPEPRGIAVLDVSDPFNIARVGFYETVSSFAESMVLRDGFMYLNTGGLEIVDVGDPTNPTQMSSFTLAGPSSGMSLSGNFAFMESEFYDISNQSEPKFLLSQREFTLTIRENILDERVIYAVTNFGFEIADLNDCICEVDLNIDGRNNYFDIALFLELYIARDPRADMDGNGMFNFSDVSIFIDLFSTDC